MKDATVTRLWLLGAPDPEMAIIEEILADAGERVVHATCDGVRVHPGSAYRADPPPDGEVIAVECGGDWTPSHTVDHHRPGDPGYGRPPSEYLSASSVGQTLALLAEFGCRAYESGEYSVYQTGRGEPPARGWHENKYATAPVVLRSGGYAAQGWEGLHGGDGSENPSKSTKWWEVSIPRWSNVLYAAAADHCLAAAYRGKCPGVPPSELASWRIATRAAHQGRAESEVRADYRAAKDRIESVYQQRYADHGQPVVVRGILHRIQEYDGPPIDMTGEVIPELPEAACRLGLPVLAGPLRGPDGREKVVLLAASPEHIRRFLAASDDGLEDKYGDPARGFAGGYTARP